jgi:hypothetical protein
VEEKRKLDEAAQEHMMHVYWMSNGYMSYCPPVSGHNAAQNSETLVKQEEEEDHC